MPNAIFCCWCGRLYILLRIGRSIGAAALSIFVLKNMTLKW